MLSLQSKTVSSGTKKRSSFEERFFSFWICHSLLKWVSHAIGVANPVHISHSEIEKLAFQAEGVDIFATGEYLGGTSKNLLG